MTTRTVAATTRSPQRANTAGAQYRRIPPEPWGRRLARVRQDVAGYTLLEAAALAGHFVLTSDATVSRLEALPVVPIGNRQRGRRQLAYILCRAYEVDPAEFGLTDDDVPPGVEIPPRSTALSTKWETPPALSLVA